MYSKAIKPGFDKVWHVIDKLGPPLNKLSNKLGAEAFWPTAIDKECDKAARILQTFCTHGVYEQEGTTEGTKSGHRGQIVHRPEAKQRVLMRIPHQIIREAKGLVIFTSMRSGSGVSMASGSGVLVARLPESGKWGPPSGIITNTISCGFLLGVDIYDCVLVINTYEALNAFTNIRCTLGCEVSAVAGPVGVGGILESEVHKRQAPVWTYLKSRGFYAGIQVDGTIIIERSDENENFYGEKVGLADILAGRPQNPPREKYRILLDTLYRFEDMPVG